MEKTWSPQRLSLKRRHARLNLQQLRWNRVVPRLKVKSSRNTFDFMNLFEIGCIISKTNDIYVTIVNGPFALFPVEVRSYDDPMKTMAE